MNCGLGMRIKKGPPGRLPPTGRIRFRLLLMQPRGAALTAASYTHSALITSSTKGKIPDHAFERTRRVEICHVRRPSPAGHNARCQRHRSVGGLKAPTPSPKFEAAARRKPLRQSSAYLNGYDRVKVFSRRLRADWVVTENPNDTSTKSNILLDKQS